MQVQTSFWVTVAGLVVVLSPSRGAAQPVAEAQTQLRQFVAAPTVTAVRSGAWSDAGTWAGGAVPGDRARVAIPAGVVVTVDREIATAYDWVRVDGTLRFRPDVSTMLVVETVVAIGRLEIGTAAAPIRPDVTARLIIRSPGQPIAPGDDPLDLTRGVIAMSSVSIYGSPVTEIVSLASLPPAGATTLQLDADPLGWKVGDELLVAPILHGLDEVVRITSVSGRTVGISPAVRYPRTNVPAPGLKVHVGHLTRNVTIATDSSQAGNKRLQGHVLLMGGGHQVHHVALNDLGRTRVQPVSDPIIRAGFRDPQLMMPCGLVEENARGRHSLRFHNPGPDSPLSIAEGVVVRAKRNYGFKVGIQNHSSYVAVRRAVVHQIDGSGILTEEGDERGEIRGSLVVHSIGSTVVLPATAEQCMKTYYPAIYSTRRADVGYRGNGIWLEGQQVDVVGNILAGHQNAGIEQDTSGLHARAPNLFEVRFPVRLLRGGDAWVPSQYKPDGMLPVSIPPGLITDNLLYGIGGIQTTSSKTAFGIKSGVDFDAFPLRPKTVIARNTAWNVVNCVDASASSETALADLTCIAGALPPGLATTTTRKGVNTAQQGGLEWAFTDVRINGFPSSSAFVPAPGSTFVNVTIDGRPYGTTTPPPPPPPAAPRPPTNVRVIR